MGIAKAQFNSLLTSIFKAGNTIRLLAVMPNESTESGALPIGQMYTIQSGDFTVSGNEVISAKNMMMYLCETKDSSGNPTGDGTAVGFAVYSGTSTTLLYFGEFTNAMEVAYNTVPTIKKYNDQIEPKEGVKVTLTSTDVS